MDTFLLLFHPNPALSQPAASQMMVTGPFAHQFGFWFVLAPGRPRRTGKEQRRKYKLFPLYACGSYGILLCTPGVSATFSLSTLPPLFSPTATLPLPSCFFRQLVPTALPRLDSGWFLPPVFLSCPFFPPGILGGHRRSVSSHPYACRTNTLPYFISQHAAKNFFIRLNIYRRRDVQ